jgi:predicted nuclease of predicted toxin-antitoxin system
MRLKLDENLSIRLKDPLMSLGFNVCTVFDEGLCGASDISVAQAAIEEERILLTLDVEFADLRKHPPGTHPGVVLFRPRSSGPLEVAQMVLEFLGHTDVRELRGSVVVVHPARVRIRRPVTAPSGGSGGEL